jgi:hypothetical protein
MEYTDKDIYSVYFRDLVIEDLNPNTTESLMDSQMVPIMLKANTEKSM